MPRGLSPNSRRRDKHKFGVPNWFKQSWHLDDASMQYWQQKYKLAKANKEHKLPENCMRMPLSELYQLMAKEFWLEISKD
jgi:hypothetical protein